MGEIPKGYPPNYVKALPTIPDYKPPRMNGGNRYHKLNFFSTIVTKGGGQDWNHKAGTLNVEETSSFITGLPALKVREIESIKLPEENNIVTQLTRAKTRKPEAGYRDGLFMMSNPSDFSNVQIGAEDGALLERGNFSSSTGLGGRLSSLFEDSRAKMRRF